MENGENCNNKLSPVQLHIMEMLPVLLNIFEKENLLYYMQGGTMLGAVRHSGFIPWDDDIDLGLMREDYEHFIKLAPNYLPEGLELRTYWDGSDHHYYFSRIVNTHYKIKRKGGAEERYENLWIDIFPLDGMPEGLIQRRCHMWKLSWWRLIYHLSCIEKVNIKRPGRSWVEKIIIKLALALRFMLHMDTQKTLRRIDELLKKYPVKNSSWVINFMGQTSFRFTEMIKKDVYGSGKQYKFENFEMTGPENYDAYLTSLYGDFMTPPMPSERNAHVSEFDNRFIPGGVRRAWLSNLFEDFSHRFYCCS